MDMHPVIRVVLLFASVASLVAAGGHLHPLAAEQVQKLFSPLSLPDPARRAEDLGPPAGLRQSRVRCLAPLEPPRRSMP